MTKATGRQTNGIGLLILVMEEIASFEMLLSYGFKCGPIRARVYEAEGSWTVTVRLFGSEKSHREIPDLATAQNIAIIYAQQLCMEYDLTFPSCLDAPCWLIARSAA
jgi:hypothetical protein